MADDDWTPEELAEREGRLDALRALRKGKGVYAKPMQADFPLELFRATDWLHFLELLKASTTLINDVKVRVAMEHAYGLSLDGLSAPSLSERRNVAASKLAVSTRTVQRLEEEGILHVEDQIRRYSNPMELGLEFMRTNILLSLAKKVFTEPDYRVELIEPAQKLLQDILRVGESAEG